MYDILTQIHYNREETENEIQNDDYAETGSFSAGNERNKFRQRYENSEGGLAGGKGLRMPSGATRIKLCSILMVISIF